MQCIFLSQNNAYNRELKDCLSETFEEIEKIKSEGIKIDGEHFDVEWWVAKIKIQSNFHFGLQI